MKKLISLILFLIAVAGVVIYLGEEGKISIQGQTPLEYASEYVEQFTESFDDDDEEELPSEVHALFCNSKGGVIENVEGDDGALQQVCFVNDGKDGIRCDAELFYKGECGQSLTEEPEQEIDAEESLQVFINQDSSSNIDLVMIAPNGEGLTAFRRQENEGPVLESLVIVSADGRAGHIEVDDQSRPTRFSFEGTVLNYSNYTDSTVDVTVELPDGSTEEYLAEPLETVFQSNPILDLFIPKAYANWITDLACTGEDCFYNTLPNVGITLNAVFCGVTLGKTLFTAGATAPLAYMSCASLATRVATLNTEIGPCKGDVLDCGKDTVFDFVKAHGPKAFREGVSLSGELRNVISGSRINTAVLSATHQRSQQSFRGENSAGRYTIEITGSGITEMNIAAEGYAEEQIIIAATNARIIVKSVRTQQVEEYSLPYEGYVDLKQDFYLEPDAFISGEVIDDQEAEPLSHVKVTLVDGGKVVDEVETDGDGTFSLQPSLSDNEHTFIINANKEGFDNFSQELPISFDVREQSDQYDIPDWNGIIKMSVSEEEEEPVDLPASVTHPIDFDFIHTGITHTGTGTLTLSFDPLDTTCGLTLEGTASGVPTVPAEYIGELPAGFQIPELTGDYTGRSVSCSGSTGTAGTFYLSGSINGTVNFSFSGQSFNDEDTLPFTVRGEMEDGKAKGEIVIDEISSIPF